MESVKKLVLIPSLEWERLVKKYDINMDEGEINKFDLPVTRREASPPPPRPPPEREEEEAAADQDEPPPPPPFPTPPLPTPGGRKRGVGGMGGVGGGKKQHTKKNQGKMAQDGDIVPQPFTVADGSDSSAPSVPPGRLTMNKKNTFNEKWDEIRERRDRVEKRGTFNKGLNKKVNKKKQPSGRKSLSREAQWKKQQKRQKDRVKITRTISGRKSIPPNRF